MSTLNNKTCRVWTVSQAKTHLSEILRLAAEEGPQHIGKKRSFVVVPASQWYASNQLRQPLGQWLVDNIPRGINLNSQFDRKSDREVPIEATDTE